MRTTKIIFLFIFLQGCNKQNETSQEKGFKPITEESFSEKRIALVMGNSNYPDMPLTNPVNDAEAISHTLHTAGFDVTLKTNLNQKDMISTIRDFGERLTQGGVALFYYSGHGTQVKGENYLIPIGADIRKESDIELEAVNAQRILAEMENARSRMNVVILDACRDNPFPEVYALLQKGLRK